MVDSCCSRVHIYFVSAMSTTLLRLRTARNYDRKYCIYNRFYQPDLRKFTRG